MRVRAAGLAMACVLGGLAACTAGGAHHHLTPAQRFFARHPFLRRPLFIPGGSGVIAFFGGGGAGTRPKISVPPVPAATSSLPIAMPLEAYQAISTDQQEALAAFSNLLAERCMAARGFTDTSPASSPYLSAVGLAQIETAGTGLNSLAQAQTFGFNKPKGTGSPAAGPGIIGIVGEPAFGQAVSLSPAYAEALYGFSPHGGAGGRPSCLQLASQAVYGPLNGSRCPTRCRTSPRRR